MVVEEAVVDDKEAEAGGEEVMAELREVRVEELLLPLLLLLLVVEVVELDNRCWWWW